MVKKDSELNGKTQALQVAVMIGCTGAHKTSDGVWMPCESREKLQMLSDTAASKDWARVVRPLRSTKETTDIYGNRKKRSQKGRKRIRKENTPMTMGVIHLDGVGLVSGNGISGKSAMTQNTGPSYVRETDPDVFMDPESARFRSRQLGCIGISRRISKNGRAVWMPCTNMSDYARRSGSTALGRRHQRNESQTMVRTILRQEMSKLKRKKSISDEILNK